jgi:hypothetical protein
MNCIRTFQLISCFALVMAPGISLAQSSSAVATGAPVLLGAEFHPGETVRYTFSEKINVTSRVDSRFATMQPNLTPRQYQVEGEIVTTFAPTQPGEPLHGTVQFQGLTIKNWVSSAKVADFEARLRQLEAAVQPVNTAADGNLELPKMPADPTNDPYFMDIEDLISLARAVVTSRISSEPLALGQRRESADFPIHGMVDPGTKATTVTEYVADVPIAHHPDAEVRLSTNAPNQPLPDSSGFKSIKSEQLQLQTRRNFHGADVLTYLLDLNAHQISFLRETGQGGVDVIIESTDTSAEVRIPLKVVTFNIEEEETVRRVVVGGPPEREADLAAFEKSLQAPSHAAAEGSGTPATAGSDGEVSLGDLARRMRAQRAAQGPPPAETTLMGSAAAGAGVPTGFKQQAFPSGGMSAFVPDQAAELQRTSDFVNLRASLGAPATVLLISMAEATVGQSGSPDDMLDEFAKGFQAKTNSRVLQSEKKTINGLHAIVMEIQFEVKGAPIQAMNAVVISEGKAFSTTCAVPEADFPKVESLCRTVVESMKVR